MSSLILVAQLAASMAGSIAFDLSRPAPDSAVAHSEYGIVGFANTSSSIDISVLDSSIHFVASRIASDGDQGYSAYAGFLLPVSADWALHDLSTLQTIDFQYRNDAKITDRFAIAVSSNAYTDEQQANALIYETSIQGSTALAAGTDWKSANLSVLDFAPPAWWSDIPADYPTIEDVLAQAKAFMFLPRTTYTAGGSNSGSVCTKCVQPTMTSLTLDVRGIVLNGVTVAEPNPIRTRIDCDESPFDVAPSASMPNSVIKANQPLSTYALPTHDTSAVRVTYGICAGSNNASTASVSVVRDSFARLEVARLATDGKEGYTAQAYMIHSLSPNGAAHDLTGLERIAFDFRNDAKITDGIRVQLISTAYTSGQFDSGTIYQSVVLGSTNLAANTNWKHVELDIADFATPSWWTDVPFDFPTIETVLQSVTAIRIQPASVYSDTGNNGGIPCTRCTAPTMPAVTLDVRNLTLQGFGGIYPPNPEPQGVRTRLDCDATPFTLAPAPGEPMGTNWNPNLASYPVSTPDSSSTLSRYGICAGSNEASNVAVSAVKNSHVRLDALLSSNGTEGYSAQAYLIHPIARDGLARDLRGLRNIRFRMRNSAKITDALAIQLVSPAYTDGQMDSGLVYETVVASSRILAAGTTWKDIEVSLLDFAVPAWWSEIPENYPTLDDVLSKVKGIRIQPRTTYAGTGTIGGQPCTRCTAPTMPAITLDIASLSLDIDGGFPSPNLDTVACTGASVSVDSLLDDFVNDLGNPWYDVSDNDSAAVRSPNASGSTLSRQVLSQGSAIGLEALLDRRMGDVRNPSAGWAGLGTALPDTRSLSTRNLKAIRFRIVPTVPFPASIPGVWFRALHAGETAATSHRVFLDKRFLENGSNDFCVHPDDLSPASASDTTSFDPAAIANLQWDIALPANSIADTATVGFLLSGLKLYGADPRGEALRVTRRADGEFSASYVGGSLLLRGFDGFERVEIRGIDGRHVASFAPTDRTAFTLARGTWFVIGVKGGTTTVRPIVSSGR